ncbi:MAG: hypothetical protein HUU35_10845, partial [Armatimonadetes bacterium]|nr:hypothetical protein [Armatimonadota bacterium]
MFWLGWGLAASLLAAEANLLTNSDFETLREPGRPAAWNLSGGATLVADPVHAGRGAVRVRFDDNCNQNVAVRAGEWYVVEGWCRAENPATTETPRVKLHFLDPGGKRLTAGGGFIENVTAQAYKPFAIAFTAPPQTAQVTISLIGEYNGSDWFLFDDVTVRSKPIQDRPAWADLPDLHQQTVVVPDRADIRSSALYRVPFIAHLPIDGDLSTAAWTHRSQDIKRRLQTVEFDLRLHRPSPVSWVLIHGLNPLRPIRQGELRVGESRRPLPATETMVRSLRWPRTTTDRAQLTLNDVAVDSAEV